jgi:U3 small nucleolar RNA-associated protein 18
MRKRRKAAQNDLVEEHAVLDGSGGAAWADPDDEELQVDLTVRNRTKKLRRFDAEATVTGVEYEKRLRDQFVALHGSASWAEERPAISDDDSSSDDEDTGLNELPATSARPIVDSASRGLRPGKLDIKALQRVEIPALATEKANPEKTVSEKAAVVQSLQFHPDSELMLTAGLDKTLRIFSVDGTDNTKVASYFFKNFPISGAAFTPDGSQILLTGRGFKMWGLDVRTGEPMHIQHHSSLQHEKFSGLITGPCPSDAPTLRANQMYAVQGDAGSLLICDVASKQPIRTLRMSVPGVAAVFSSERDVLYSADKDCTIYEWDLGTGRCKQRLKAAWATGIESLAFRRVTPHASTPVLAVGTVSGNIDLYDVGMPTISAEPWKSIGNLTTMVTSLRFHPEGEVLLGASKFKKDSLRMMHCATATVFQNWPTMKTPLNRVTSVDFSRQGGLVAMANERGKVLLYQLRHYAKSA